LAEQGHRDWGGAAGRRQVAAGRGCCRICMILISSSLLSRSNWTCGIHVPFAAEAAEWDMYASLSWCRQDFPKVEPVVSCAMCCVAAMRTLFGGEAHNLC
jgi:hypothetical protein